MRGTLPHRSLQVIAVLELLLVECMEHPSSHTPLLSTLHACADEIHELSVDEQPSLPKLFDMLLLLPSRWSPVDTHIAASDVEAPAAAGAAAGTARCPVKRCRCTVAGGTPLESMQVARAGDAFGRMQVAAPRLRPHR